ncbi:MAG: sigma-70 family RNA polymerase sigma factor [Deltaproteobacteria bacterium]|nr:sigma-70 family RNA polymerase sigma factor [Deltaproteobacteria bacterium]
MNDPVRAYAEARGLPALSVEDEARLGALLAVGAESELAGDPRELAIALAHLPAEPSAMRDDDVRELVLALACDRGEPAALRELERAYAPAVEAALRAMKLDDDARADVWQEVKAKLLVREGGPIRLVSYAGRGTLRGLLKVTATRTALTMMRDSRRERPHEPHTMEAAAGEAAELDFVKVGARAAFREAFASAIETLDPHARNLLRLHHLRKVGLEQLATMYGVHRATIVRQLAAARAQVERETGKALRARLDLERGEVEDVIDLVRSHFDASVERLLKTQT